MESLCVSARNAINESLVPTKWPYTILLHKPEAQAKDLRWRFRLVCGRFPHGDIALRPEFVAPAATPRQQPPVRTNLTGRGKCATLQLRNEPPVGLNLGPTGKLDDSGLSAPLGSVSAFSARSGRQCSESRKCWAPD
jgi:hypothetical protein